MIQQQCSSWNGKKKEKKVGIMNADSTKLMISHYVDHTVEQWHFLCGVRLMCVCVRVLVNTAFGGPEDIFNEQSEGTSSKWGHFGHSQLYRCIWGWRLKFGGQVRLRLGLGSGLGCTKEWKMNGCQCKSYNVCVCVCVYRKPQRIGNWSQGGLKRRHHVE